MVGNQTLIENHYNVSRGLLTHSLYGNGQKIGYTYDMLDRVTEKRYNDIVKVKFRYDKFGNLYEKQDLFTNTTYRYSYDLIGRITGVNGSDNTSLGYVYDDFNRIEKYVAKFGDKSNVTEYIHGSSSVSGQKDGLIYGVKQNDVERISYAYDSLARLNTRTLNTTTPFVTQYGYYEGATDGTTTTLVKTVQNGSDLYEYTYDAVGNITEIKKNGTVYESYTYDSLGQLTLIARGGNSFYYYDYDSGGNILSEGLNGVTIKSYTYGDSQWRDKLTEFNGYTITYDSIGNPLQYRDGFNFTWSNGRQLTGITKGTDTISYLYNADGLRASKTVNGTTTDYYWLEGVLLGQKTGDDYIIYLYDENGAAYGIIYNDTYYYYVFNAQGDVVGIIDQNGSQVVSYDYSAWGEVLSITGTMADTLGQQNPIRYRGYYYDTETGFYYLRSRYYDPVTHRFINADGLVSTGQGILGNNMFAYCGNNPVNRADSGGCFWGLVIGTVLVIGLVVSLAGCSGPEPLPYNSADEAALAFSNSTYSASQYIRHEYGTVIYSRTSNGTTTYDYTTPVAGGPHGVGITIDVPAGTTAVATAHTHPNSNEFSDRRPVENTGDIPVAISINLNSYLVGPNLNLQRYNVDSDSITDVETVNPIALTIQQQTALVSQFQISWDNHLGTCNFGCENMTWPTS